MAGKVCDFGRGAFEPFVVAAYQLAPAVRWVRGQGLVIISSSWSKGGIHETLSKGMDG